MAFQLTDDVMDIVATETELRKPPGLDLREGIYILPVIFTLRSNDDGARLRTILARMKLERQGVDEALAILRQNDSILKTMAVARSFIQQAKTELERLPAGSAE